MYTATYHEKWQEKFNTLENSLKIAAVKKIAKILENPHRRHLGHGAKFFVAQIGQTRIVYSISQ